MKKQVWVIYYENDGFEVFSSKKSMLDKIRNLDTDREWDKWITKPVLSEDIKFSSPDEYERELKRFVKKGWNKNLDHKIALLAQERNQPDETKVHRVGVRKEIESLFKLS